MLPGLGAGIVLVGIAALVVLGRCSRTAPRLGLVDGRLRVCSNSSNCVCSESGSGAIKPWAIFASGEDAWRNARAAVEACGGKVETTGEGYLHATFTSRVFGFVDDLELRLDQVEGVIHVRSASRMGGFDWGVNRKRTEQLRIAYAALQSAE